MRSKHKSKYKQIFTTILTIILFGFVALCCIGTLIPDKTTTSYIPINDGYITDNANLLSSKEKEELEQKISTFSDIQLGILTVKSLPNNLTLEEFSNKVFNDWKIGDKKTNRGLLFVYVQSTDKMRLEVGYGLEGDIPDITAKHILQEIHPSFTAKNYAKGISQLVECIGNVGKVNEADKKNSSSGDVFSFILAAIIVILAICYIVDGNKSYIISSTRDSSRNNRFGGFGGFGGGSSGGGGASD
ncbi:MULTISPECIES: TPM domain-containing protein [Clostridium]|jgi:uncharacterized protein|uniref:TPM domain-containing protein n=1 Tax=Clostridium TaxID=1485 RepID=UPI000E8669FB|nr:TPM domain-containing protein [Clostridium tyrobutyricum]HBF76923.1 hypothetical protein [Clostridiaceae bacterium]